MPSSAPDVQSTRVAVSGCLMTSTRPSSVTPAKTSNFSGTVAPFFTVFQTRVAGVLISTGW